MKSIEEAAEKFAEDRRLNSQGYPPKVWFKAGVEFAQRWIPIEEELPICTESGDWDGLRSEWVLVKSKDEYWTKAQLYSGTLDGHKYDDWYDDDNYRLCNITHWRPIEIL